MKPSASYYVPYLLFLITIILRNKCLISNIRRETLESYATEIKKLAMAILYHMAKALRMDGEEIKELFENGVQSMRMNYYPPCPQPDKAIGFSPHSDADALTILLQLNETEGLEIRKDGRWLPVNPLKDAFILNIGDIMEVVTLLSHLLHIYVDGANEFYYKLKTSKSCLSFTDYEQWHLSKHRTQGNV